jgi:hypothetical protein
LKPKLCAMIASAIPLAQAWAWFCCCDLHQALSSGSSLAVPPLLSWAVSFCVGRAGERLEEFKSQEAFRCDLTIDFSQQFTPRSFGCMCVEQQGSLFCPSRMRRFFCCWQQSYLVDPASSHMLVSKIKPCMSKYKQLYTVKLRTAHYISNNLFDGFLLHG